MSSGIYRFEFGPSVPLRAAEQSLHLALFSAEGLFGEARVRMDVAYHIDEQACTIEADGSTDAGRAVIQMFTALLTREFGHEGFRVRRVPGALSERAELSASAA